MEAMEDFSSKVICITGASGGIGGAIADFFLKKSASLILVSRSTPRFTPAGNVLIFTGDISNRAFVKKFVAESIKKFKKIDVLVNAAAILGPIGPLYECDPGQWEETIRVNLVGTFLTMREIVPHMVCSKRGKVINFAGGGAAYSYPRFSAYGSSKAAVVRFTEIAADELAEHNVQVNVIAPGAVDTKMLAAVKKAGGEVRNEVPVELPVKLVAFLASSASDHLTGRFIHSREEYEKFGRDLEPDLYKLRRKPF